MYAKTGLMFPYFDNFFQEVQQNDDFCRSHKPNGSMDIQSSLIPTTAISDYYLGVEGDLFKAPEPLIEEPLLGLDPMAAAISMMSCGEDAIPAQSLSVSDIESSIESGQLLSEVFYECRKDLMAKDGSEAPFSEALTIPIPTVKTDENLIADGLLQKSASSSCLRLTDCMLETQLKPNFLEFPVLDFGYGMRRAFSEGDIKTLGNTNAGHAQSNQPSMRQPTIMNSCISEERKEKLSRYWNKKSKRNFGRKIKYACRKALADNQPRIRGRFAKTE